MDCLGPAWPVGVRPHERVVATFAHLRVDRLTHLGRAKSDVLAVNKALRQTLAWSGEAVLDCERVDTTQTTDLQWSVAIWIGRKSLVHRKSALAISQIEAVLAATVLANGIHRKTRRKRKVPSMEKFPTRCC